jgi:CRP-like cAMP-binding protein
MAERGAAPSMPAGLGRVERELIVRARILADASPTQIAQLLAHERDVTFAPGQVLVTQGQAPRRFYLVVDGEVDVDGLPDRFGAGTPIGVTDALLDRPYLRTARATGVVHAIAMDVRDYFDFLEENPDLALTLIGNLAGDVHGHLLALPVPERFLGLPHGPLVTDAADSLVERLPVVRHVRPFVRASIQAQVSLADDAQPRRLPAGDILFRAGAPADTVWMIASGTVAVDTVSASGERGPVRLVCGPGDLVEHHAALTSGPRRASAAALTDTLLLGLPREALHDRMEEHFDLVRSILAYLASEQERILQARALLRPSTRPPIAT